MFLRTKIRAVQQQVAQWRMPSLVTLTDFDPAGIRFEISSMVERHRVVHHGDETDYTRAMLDYLQPNDVLWDIGTNVGLVALHAARRCRTVAFEPDPAFLDRLRRNLSLNPELDVQVQPIAISDVDGTVTLYTDGAGGNSPSLAQQRGEKGSVSVAARSIDSLIVSGAVPHPTVLKLDIEGAEVLALRGAHDLLRSDRAPRALFIEIHDSFLPAFGSSADEVRGLLADSGYTHQTYRAPRAEQHHLILQRVQHEPADAAPSS